MAEADDEFLLFLSGHGNLEQEYLFVSNNGVEVENQRVVMGCGKWTMRNNQRFNFLDIHNKSSEHFSKLIYINITSIEEGRPNYFQSFFFQS